MICSMLSQNAQQLSHDHWFFIDIFVPCLDYKLRDRRWFSGAFQRDHQVTSPKTNPPTIITDDGVQFDIWINF